MKGFDEGILCEIGCVFVIGGYVIDYVVNVFVVFYDEVIKGGDVVCLYLLNGLLVGVGFLLVFGGVD